MRRPTSWRISCVCVSGQFEIDELDMLFHCPLWDWTVLFFSMVLFFYLLKSESIRSHHQIGHRHLITSNGQIKWSSGKSNKQRNLSERMSKRTERERVRLKSRHCHKVTLLFICSCADRIFIEDWKSFVFWISNFSVYELVYFDKHPNQIHTHTHSEYTTVAVQPKSGRYMLNIWFACWRL